MAALLPRGNDISDMLKADWPVIKCVILRASSRSSCGSSGANICLDDAKQPAKTAEDQETNTDEDSKTRTVLIDLIDEIDIDLSPPKQSVATILGGAFTFAGQYEDEGVVLIVRNTEDMENPNDLPENPHLLQPPLDKEPMRGDILIMRVAATEEELDDEDAHQIGEGTKDIVPPTNTEFFLSYTKDEYIAFASRTDIVSEIVEGPDVEADEGEHCTDDDEDDDDEEGDEGDEDADEGEEDEEYCIGDEEVEERTGILNMLMASLLRRFRDDNGRGPNTQEVLDIRQALASKMGFDLEDIPPLDEPAAKRGKPVVQPSDPTSPYNSILAKRRFENAGDEDGEEVFPVTKKVKFGAEIETAAIVASIDNEGEKKGE